MKTVISLLISVFASSSFASLTSTHFTCKSVESGLVFTTTPKVGTVQVYANKALVQSYENTYTTYSYHDTLTPMLIDVNIIDADSGEVIAYISEQAGTIIAALNGDYSYTCTKK